MGRFLRDQKSGMRVTRRLLERTAQGLAFPQKPPLYLYKVPPLETNEICLL